MLNPYNDRMYYGKILSPPEDCELDFAIATTYSLDLDSLIGASISIGLSDDIDSDLSENPIFLLDALRKTSNKIVLFCEKGQIHLPNNPNQLYTLLENMLFEVITSKTLKRNKYASFHPKMWLLKYKDENNNFSYRFIVLSRNLTFDRSWDISFTMDGKKGEKLTNKNDALISFIDYLKEFATDENKIKKMNEIAEELKYVNFDLESSDFKDFDFIVNGIGNDYSIQNHSLFDENLDELLIVSPFLSNSTILGFNTRKNKKSKALLFTRYESLPKLKAKDCDNFEVYVLKDEIVCGEPKSSEESQEILKQDIHAKIFAVEDNRFTDLYLGSLNATQNAFWENIEFMIKLRARKKTFNVNNLANDLFNSDKGGSNDPFQMVNMENILPEEESEEKQLDYIIKYICRLDSKAMIVSNDDFYNIELEFNDLNFNMFRDVTVYVKPLLSNKEREFCEKIIFKNISKLNLSEFFVISVRDNEGKFVRRVIKVKCEGMPVTRDNEVISSIISDETSFIKYVAFLLGDDYILNAIENENIGKSSKNFNFQLPELYEKMLKAARYSPEKFKEIEFLINSLSEEDIIPEGFEELYNTFIKVID